jgi:hypothetical protein
MIGREARMATSETAEVTVTDGTRDARSTRHISILGGLKRTGQWRLGSRNLVVTILGGADLDMTHVDFVAPDVSITLICILGGADLRVPAKVRVETGGFVLLGSQRLDVPQQAGLEVRLRLRTFGFLGGVRVRTT